MADHKIVFLERESIRGSFRRPDFPHAYDEYPLTKPEELAARVRDASIIIVNKVQLRGELLATLPNLKMIAVAATGTDNVDLAWCREHGVVASNIRGYAVNTVPEHVIALTMALRRNLLAYRRDVQAGKWQQAPMFCFFDHPIGDLHGATLGIFGRGSLGEGVARLAEVFGMRVLWGEHKGETKVRPGRTAFADVLREADVISLHCPLNEATRGMIGEAELKLMKPDAVLINTARGGLVDEAALAAMLREGRLGGAALDVFGSEPLPAGSALVGAPRLLLTPHIAGVTLESNERVSSLIADRVAQALERS